MPTILLLEDSPAVMQIMNVFLSSKDGYFVLQASTWGEAVKRLNESRADIDLLIADVSVEGQSGLGIANQLRTICPGLSVLFTSGYSEDHLVRNGLLGRTDRFLAKPFMPESLLLHVAEILKAQTKIANGTSAT
jgi:two-component system, cell cycle sensor histidine kinase and response regulator CckA